MVDKVDKNDVEQDKNSSAADDAIDGGRGKHNPVTDVARKARELEAARFNYTLGDPDDASVGGGLARHGGAGSLGAAQAGSGDKAKRRSRRQTDDLLWRLQQQQAYWQDQYDTYAGDVEALSDYHDKLVNGEIGPDDPVPADVQAAIDRYKAAHPDQDIDAHNAADIKQVLVWATDQRDNAAEQKQEIEAELAERNQQRLEAVQQKAARSDSVEKLNTEAGRNSFLDRDEKAALQNETQDAMTKAEEVEDLEQDIVALTLAELEPLKGKSEYIEKLDEFVAGLDEKTRGNILRDQGTDPVLRERIEILRFKESYAELNDLKEQPDYATYVAALVDELSNAARTALRREANLPDDVREHLNPDDAWQGTSVASAQDANAGSELSDKFNAQSTGADTQAEPQVAHAGHGRTLDSPGNLPG